MALELVSTLGKAGFTAHEIEAKIVAAFSNQRPSNPITQFMDNMRIACATSIAQEHSRFLGNVSVTEMSLGNNFNIVYGPNDKEICIVTEHGDVAIMDDGDLHFLPGGEEPSKLAKYVVEYMVGGRGAMYDKIDADEPCEQ